MYFAYGERELSYLRQKDKRLGAVIDRIGQIDRSPLALAVYAAFGVLSLLPFAVEAAEAAVWRHCRTKIPVQAEKN